MVLVKMDTWKQVFNEIDKMCAGELIDAIRIVYVSSLTGRNLSQLEPVRSPSARADLAENLPGTLPRFTHFELERGDDEVLLGETLRVLIVRASGHLAL